MKSSPAMLAVVTDAFGGRGGIAQYNRDFFGSVGRSSNDVIDYGSTTACTRPTRAASRNRTNARAARTARLFGGSPAICARPVGRCCVLWTRLYGSVSGTLIARLKAAKLIIQTHGIEAWPRPSRIQREAVESADLLLCVSRYTRRRCSLGRQSRLSGCWSCQIPSRKYSRPQTV